jgi:histidinol-phosphate aminotransferase
MSKRLADIGFEVTPSQANFLWCRHPSGQHRAMYDHCKAGGYLVRFMDYPNFGNGLRISVGTDPQVDACIDLLEGWLNRQ